MDETLTVFQGHMLREMHIMGTAHIGLICGRMAHKLDKSVQHQNSTIAASLEDLVKKDFVVFEERIEGELKIAVKYYSLTEKALKYINAVGATA